MDEERKLKIRAARKAVDSYREAHAHLYKEGWRKEIPKEHTTLLEQLLAELQNQGFSSLEQFFAQSEELNIEELGFTSRDEFERRAKEKEREALERMWH